MYIARAMLPRYAKKIEELISYTNIKIKPERFSNFVIMSSFLIALIVMFISKIYLSFFYIVLVFFATFLIIIVFFHVSLVLQADRKASIIETSLPDALQLMASNLRAGLTTDKALIASAREEFGVLQDELLKVSKEIATGKSMENALNSLCKRVKSDIFVRTINLIIFGIKSGGELASLLDEAASSLRQQMLTQKQIRTSVMMYTILIFIALIFVAPILFALSNILVETLVKALTGVEFPSIAEMTTLPLTITPISIEPGFIFLFTLITLIITTIMGSLVLGLIMTGEERNGVKFMPFLLAVAIAIFFAVRMFLSKMFAAVV